MKPTVAQAMYQPSHSKLEFYISSRLQQTPAEFPRKNLKTSELPYNITNLLILK